MHFTKDQFILCYNGLSNQNQKQEANTYTIRLGESPQAWRISRVILSQFQELLNESNSTHKFLGAQMLHLKTRDSFQQLNAQQQEELTSYVFSLLFEVCGNNNKPVIAKLAGTCAVIITHASQNIHNLESFLIKLGEAMKSSANHLRAGLEVIEQIPDQCKGMRNKSFVERKIIKNILLEKSIFFINMFISIFNTNDVQCITKNLEALVSWADFGLPIMEHPELVTPILTNAIKTIQNLDFTTQIFGFVFKYHFFKQADSVESVTLTKQQLSQKYLQNLVLIVKFIIESSHYIFEQMNSQHLYNYGFLVKELILYHPWIISEDITAVGQPLLQFMIIVLQQKSFKVSSVAVDFWKQFYFKVKNNTNIQNNVLGSYFNVYDKLISKTLRVDLPKYLIKQNEQVVYQDETDDGEADDEKVTFEKYRQDCSFLFQSILIAFKDVPEGTQLFFNKISELILSNNDCKVELGLFIVYSSITVMKDKSSDIIPNTIDYCCQCTNTNPNIKKHIAKIFSQLSDEIRIYNKFQPVLLTILNYLTDPEMSQLASKTFDDLMISMPQHANITLVQRMIDDCKNNLRQLNNIPLFTKILSGVLTLIQKLQDQEYSVGFLKQLLEESLRYFQIVIQSNVIGNIELSLNQTELYLVHFQKLAKQKHPSAVMATAYYSTILNDLIKVFQICKDIGIKYNSFNTLGLATSIYCKIIKNIGVSHLKNFDIINTASLISCVNSRQNCQVLKVVIVTIQQSVGSSLPLLDNWISDNLTQFVQTYLNLIQTTLDPDIIRNFYLLIDRTTKYNPSVLIFIPSNNKIIETGLKLVASINQLMMSKCILQFILSALNIPSINLQSMYQVILVHLLEGLQYLGANGTIITSQIFIKILNNQSLDNLNNILVRIINQTAVKNLDKLYLIVEIIGFFILTSDESGLKSALIYLGLVLKGLGQNDIMALEMKYRAAKKNYKVRQ